jgi:Bacterial membrane protein YfhO
MPKLNFAKLLPHIVAIASFIVISLIYCKPALEGKVLQQSDIAHWKGMSKDIQDYKETHDGVAPLWTISMFSGMPGFLIATNNNNFISYAASEVFSLFIPKPFRFFILACLGFYFLALVLRVNPWIGMIGALAYAYSTYDPVIVSVGHDTKMLSIAYLPAALGGLIMIFSGRYWLGAAFTALFSSILVYQNHYQIVYYFVLIIAFMTIAHIIQWVKEKQVKHMVTALGFALVAGLVGIATNAMMLMTTYDYSKATIRGGQASLNLNDTLNTANQNKGGLDTAYAFLYGSYGRAETMTLLIPDMYGGNSRPLGEESKLVEYMNEKGFPPQFANQLYSSFPSYWGNQPGHSGPVYLGALICFLFVFAMLYVKSKHKWWLFAVTVLAIMMSWGKNLAGFNTFLFENLPYYNKFRAPAMILIIPQLSFSFLAVLALQQAFYGEGKKEELLKKLKQAGLVMAGIFVVALLMYFGFDYTNDRDRYIQQQLSQMMTDQPGVAREIVQAAADSRKEIFASDLLRSLFFVAAAFLMLFLFAKNKMKAQHAVIVLLLLTAFDILPVGKRYLSNENFLEPEENDAIFNPTQADQQILQDKDPNYRVFNLTQDVFNDAITSYHHRSVGGYHAAKLSLYQDLIENQLAKQPMNIQVLNMLNTKYVIVPDSLGQPFAQLNGSALGPAWLVRNINFVPNAAAEMKALDNFNAAEVAVVPESYKASIPKMPVFDSTASIRIEKNDHDVLNYTFNAAADQFAVFSEVYYNRGWKAFIDGKEVPIIKTNYVLRGLAVPAGTHKIEFRFEPASYIMGTRITSISQIILVVVFIIALYMEYRRRKTAA